MTKSQIKPGIEYALREKRTAGSGVQRVRVISHVRGGKWKAEWIEPNPGLIYYISSSQGLAPWRDHEAFLNEETDAERLR